MSSDLQFPPLDALAARLVEEGAETLRFEIDAPVLVRRPDPREVVEDTRSFHTRGAASVSLVEEALRRSGRQAGTGISAPREGEGIDEVRVGAVVFLRKRAGATTFQERIGIGRTANMDACIPLPRISKYHAFLTESGGGYELADARSTFGTEVDGVKLEPLVAVPVEDGANLMLGPYAFRFHTIAGLIAHLERMNRVRQG